MNTPVERHWRDVNVVTWKYKKLFELLEGVGALDRRNPEHIFSLITVFSPSISKDVDRFYRALRLSKKERDTRNPNFPRGTTRRTQLYHEHQSLLFPCSAPQVDTIRIAGEQHFAGVSHVHGAAWQQDPLAGHSRAQRIRDRVMDKIRPDCSVSELFAAHLSITILFQENCHFIGKEAEHEAVEIVLKLRGSLCRH